MLGFLLCLAAFLGALAAGKLSLVKGMAAVLAVGYVYGITRSNIPGMATHFLFDAALMGLYAAQVWKADGLGNTERTRNLRLWMFLLCAWPALLTLVPVQPLMVSLVGLRGNILFLPSILLGARLFATDVEEFALWAAGLNLVALAVAGGEFFLGIERFMPMNEVTMLMFNSADVGEAGAHRIPSTFSSAHAYAGTLVTSMPFLFGAWVQSHIKGWRKLLLLGGLLAAMVGVLLAATRQHFLMLAIVVAAAMFALKIRASQRIAFLIAIAALAWVVAHEERMQRFTSLQDQSEVNARLSLSLNRGFWDIALEYPMGNGMGGGGTNMPYFLLSQLRNRVYLENEYARILLEQGWIGLGLWIGFLVWAFTRATLHPKDRWRPGLRLIWISTFAYVATAFIGTGLLISVPQAFLLLTSLGWMITASERRSSPPEGAGLLSKPPIDESRSRSWTYA